MGLAESRWLWAAWPRVSRSAVHRVPPVPNTCAVAGVRIRERGRQTLSVQGEQRSLTRGTLKEPPHLDLCHVELSITARHKALYGEVPARGWAVEGQDLQTRGRRNAGLNRLEGDLACRSTHPCHARRCTCWPLVPGGPA